MPMGKKPCGFPGCPALIDSGRYCPEHEQPERTRQRREQDARRHRDPSTSMAARFRSSAAWQRLRRAKLAMNPICEDPHKIHQDAGTTETAVQVHHIESIALAPHKRAEMDNLMALCETCHDIFSRLERAGLIRCEFCAYEFDQAAGRYGCPNCEGEALE